MAVNRKLPTKLPQDRNWIVQASAHGCHLEGDWPYSQKQVVTDRLRQLVRDKGITLSEEDIVWDLHVRDKPLVDVHAEFRQKEAAEWMESRQLRRTGRGFEPLSQADLDREYEQHLLKAQEAFNEISSRRKRKSELESNCRELISEFKTYQLKAREYLSLKEAAEFWAREVDKELQDIFSKLMEFACLGGFEKDKPPLLLLSDYARVDLQWLPGRPHGDMSPQELEDGYPSLAQIDASTLKDMRSSSSDKAVLAQVIPYCWARRDTLVKVMMKRGLDRAEMPAIWFPEGLSILSAKVSSYPPLKKDLSSKPRAALELMKQIWPDGYPTSRSAEALARDVTKEYEKKKLDLPKTDGRGQRIKSFTEDDIKRALGRK
jgi:hypothetical protein